MLPEIKDYMLALSYMPSAPSRKFWITPQLLSALPRKYIYIYTYMYIHIQKDIYTHIHSFDILSVQTSIFLCEEEGLLTDVAAYFHCCRKILFQKTSTKHLLKCFKD